MPLTAAVISGLQKFVLYETRAVSISKHTINQVDKILMKLVMFQHTLSVHTLNDYILSASMASLNMCACVREDLSL